ncbi:6-carboxytetrahydropterin synthase [Dolichospermum sp. ST_sed1]|nr:6-carboxytetrahydropterin synthase [Dolichospermum sp. ST_sed1]
MGGKTNSKGAIDSNGMVMNLNELKRIIDEAIIVHVDHRHLNHEVAFLKDVNPTSENLVVCFWHQLQKFLPAGCLEEVILVETENNVVSYRGE